MQETSIYDDIMKDHCQQWIENISPKEEIVMALVSVTTVLEELRSLTRDLQDSL